jgi:serine/threonine protein kinase/tetratricopeptide (TPR) repeat protein
MTVATFRFVEGAEPISGYRLESFLGKGGFGEVWRATAPGGFPVALKFLVVDEVGSERELRSLHMLQHVRDGHLLSVQGIWQIPGYIMLAMELADGTLADRLNQCRKEGLSGVPRDELLRWFTQAAAGLDFLNEPRHVLEPGGKPVAIQHADVKPQNLLLIGSACKVGDFGLLRLLGGSSAQKTTSMTAAYAPPEVFEGKPTRSSDQYSLAVTWCSLRGGRLPFEGGPVQLMYAHVAAPPDLTMLPEAERPAVARALSKQPGDRWPSCAAFVEALRSAAAGTPPESAVRREQTLLQTMPAKPELARTETQVSGPSRTVPVGDRGQSRGGRRVLWLSLAALVTMSIGLVVFWSLRRSDHGNSDQPGNQTGGEASAEGRKKQDYERLVTAGHTALSDKRYEDAIEKANEALKLFPGDHAAVALKADARAAQDAEAAPLKKLHDYEQLMTSAKAALLKKEYDKALQDAEMALKLVPDDREALNLKKGAQTGLDAAAASRTKKREFDQLIDLGYAALADEKYEDAITKAEAALQLFPDDPKALALRKDTQALKTGAELKVKKKQDFDRLIGASKSALVNKQYGEALLHANVALKLFPDDPDALKLKKDIHTAKNQDFDRTIAASKSALLNKQYGEALLHANVALKLFPDDPDALKLKKDIETARDMAVVQKTPRTRSRDGSREYRIRNDRLECMQVPSGKLYWSSGAEGGLGFLGLVLSEDDKRVFVIRENGLSAFDAMKPDVVWKTEPRPPVRFSVSGFLLANDNTIVCIVDETAVHAYDAKTGKQVWTRMPQPAVRFTRLILTSDKEAVFAIAGGTTFKLELKTGMEKHVPPGQFLLSEVQKKLHLTDEQKKRVAELDKDLERKVSMVLTVEQRKRFAELEGKVYPLMTDEQKKKVTELENELVAKVRLVLTDEQKKILDDPQR